LGAFLVKRDGHLSRLMAAKATVHEPG